MMIGSLLDAAESALDGDTAASQTDATTVRGEISALRAVIAYHQNDPQAAVQAAQAALPHLRPEMQYATGLASQFYIYGLQALGRQDEATDFAYRQLEQALGRKATTLALHLLLALASIHIAMADLPALRTVATTMEPLAHQNGLGLSIAWSHVVHGWMHYLRNELAAAEACFRRLLPIAQTAHARALLDGCTGLVLTLLAQGRPAEALDVAALLRQHLLERGMLALAPIVDSLEQRVRLVSEPEAAQDWRVSGDVVQGWLNSMECPGLTWVRTLLARGMPDDLVQAGELLAGFRAAAAVLNSNYMFVELGVLQALVHLAQGDETAALAAAREAVERAAPGGALRIVVDCGPGVIDLLQKLQGAGVAPDFIRQVLAAFDATATATAGPPPSRAAAGAAVEQPVPVEVLTNREIDVLILLAQRLSDKEIASRLVLAPETVKKHTSHIYRKLGVHNRRAAAAQARRLGLA
jgi:LuxR family maltose regulon positive regulatory protein